MGFLSKFRCLPCCHIPIADVDEPKLEIVQQTYNQPMVLQSKGCLQRKNEEEKEKKKKIIRFVVISDSHNCLSEINVPQGK